MTRSEFKAQSRFFRTRNPQPAQFDRQGMLTRPLTETCRDVLFMRSAHVGHAVYYRNVEHAGFLRAFSTHLLCNGNASPSTIRSRLALCAEASGSLPLPA